MNLNDFYVLVDTEKKEIIDKIQKLPQNWKNIAGLPGLSDEELEDLKWAGHHNLGWVNIHSNEIKKYSSSPENFELNKNTLKSLISEKRKEFQDYSIEFNDAKIKTDIKTRYSLFLLSNQDQVYFKCVNGYYLFSKEQILKILNLIETKIRNLFEEERKIFEDVDRCSSVSEFYKINIKFTNK